MHVGNRRNCRGRPGAERMREQREALGPDVNHDLERRWCIDDPARDLDDRLELHLHRNDRPLARRAPGHAAHRPSNRELQRVGNGAVD